MHFSVIFNNCFILKNERIPFSSIAATSLTHQIFSQLKTQSEAASRKLADEYGEPIWCRGTGMRNTHTLAIAPTVSNSTIVGGISAGIEPIPANVYTFNSAKGTFIRKNAALESYHIAFFSGSLSLWALLV